eukprot:jgi/Mesen1/10522/ME000083S10031
MAAVYSGAHLANISPKFELLLSSGSQSCRTSVTRNLLLGANLSFQGPRSIRQPRPARSKRKIGQISVRVITDRSHRDLLTVCGESTEDIVPSSLGSLAEDYGQVSLPGSVVEEGTGTEEAGQVLEFAAQVATTATSLQEMAVRRKSKRQSERETYLFAAIASSIGFTALAGGAVVYRFVSQMQSGGQVPYAEISGTFALAIGAAVGMEYWARWAHKALWHASLWNMHESHHRPREGPFELNDIFAITNAVPAILLLAYGFFNKGFVPGLCFGAGLGITLFGMAYMFVHDGLVHRRFPVGPIANVPYLQKVAAAHQLHHADKFEGVPYGLFLGPQELEAVGGLPDLQALMKIRQAGASVPTAGAKDE